MTLSEIETTIQELAVRHDGLTEEMLTTLLLSAGWEDKNIKEAATLFKQGSFSKNEKQNAISENRSPVQVENKKEPAPVSPSVGMQSSTIELVDNKSVTENSADMLITGSVTGVIAQNSSEEKKLQEQFDVVNKSQAETLNTIEAKITQVDVPDIKVINQDVVNPLVHTQAVPDVAQANGIPKDSLIVHTEPVKIKAAMSQAPLPDNLPLLPFESSPHVWSFSKYKDVFHPDDTHPLPFEIAGHNLPDMHQSTKLFREEQEAVQSSISLTKEVIKEPVQQSVVSQHYEVEKKEEVLQKQEEIIPTIIKKELEIVPETLTVYDNEEVAFEKVPLTKGDESLVFLAGVMLLVIILILGYMYSNGRL